MKRSMYRLGGLRHSAARAAASIVFAATVLGLTGSGAAANEFDDWHPFGHGTWRTVRVVSETLDEKGHVSMVSVTETKTTLVDASEDRVVLQVATTVEMAGRRFESPPTRVVRGPYGEILGEKVAVKALPDERLEVDGHKVDCRSREVEIVGADQRRVVQVLYDNRLPPYELRRVVTASDDKNQKIYTATTDVLALEMPHKVVSEIKPTAFTRTVHRNHKSTTTTHSVVSPDVPGQLVGASAKEMDSGGRLVRRSTTELVNYEVVPADPRPAGVGARVKLRREERRSRRNG